MQQYKLFGKRTFDLTFSLLALPFLVPIFLLAIIVILVNDGRPIFLNNSELVKREKYLQCGNLEQCIQINWAYRLIQKIGVLGQMVSQIHSCSKIV